MGSLCYGLGVMSTRASMVVTGWVTMGQKWPCMSPQVQKLSGERMMKGAPWIGMGLAVSKVRVRSIAYIPFGERHGE